MIYRIGHQLTWISRGKTFENHIINLHCQELATELVYMKEMGNICLRFMNSQNIYL